MPNRDQTGPQGQGPLTGRGLGPCRTGAGAGRGFGRGMGRGRAVIQPQEIQMTSEQERKILEAEKTEIEKRLKEITPK